jgi:hypothetical protein
MADAPRRLWWVFILPFVPMLCGIVAGLLLYLPGLIRAAYNSVALWWVVPGIGVASPLLGLAVAAVRFRMRFIYRVWFVVAYYAFFPYLIADLKGTWLAPLSCFYWCYAAVGLLMGLHVATLRPERRPGVCEVCGYDLRATPDRCPECGTLVSRRPAEKEYPPCPWRRWPPG